MGVIKDLKGQRFGRLTVIEESEINNKKSTVWLCKCDCGNETNVTSSNLSGGSTKSCGCLMKENGMATMKIMHDREWVEGTSIKNINQRIPTTNNSGYKGVSWDKHAGKWMAYIMFKRKTINLGRYENKQDAIEARRKAEEKYFLPILEKYGHELNREECSK